MTDRTTTTTTTIADPTTLADAAAGVRNFSPLHLLRLAHLFALDPEISDHLTSRPDADPGERSWAELASTPHLQIWLIRWPVGASTGWHDHGGSAGAFTVVSGALVERTRTSALHEAVVGVGESRAFGGSYTHDVVNRGETEALSIHAYAPSLSQMTHYDLVDGALVPSGVEQRGQW